MSAPGATLTCMAFKVNRNGGPEEVVPGLVEVEVAVPRS